MNGPTITMPADAAKWLAMLLSGLMARMLSDPTLPDKEIADHFKCEIMAQYPTPHAVLKDVAPLCVLAQPDNPNNAAILAAAQTHGIELTPMTRRE